MTNEEIQEIVAKAEDNYDRLKDKVHEQYDEIKRLKEEYIMLQNASDKVEEEKDREIERLNNILDTLMQDMALLNATSKKEIKPKYVFDRIATLRGVDKE